MKQPISRAYIKRLCNYLTSVQPEVLRATYTYRMLRDSLKEIGHWKAKPRGRAFKKEDLPIDVPVSLSHADISDHKGYHKVIKRWWNMELGEEQVREVWVKDK